MDKAFALKECTPQGIRLSQREGTHRRGSMKAMPAGTDGRAILRGSLGGELLDMSLKAGKERDRLPGEAQAGRNMAALRQERVHGLGGPLCVGLFTVKP